MSINTMGAEHTQYILKQPVGNDQRTSGHPTDPNRNEIAVTKTRELEITHRQHFFQCYNLQGYKRGRQSIQVCLSQ
jgi:hypothetical protein